MSSVGSYVRNSVYPVDGHPLVFVAERLHCLDHLAERHIKVIVHHHQVDVLVVFALQQGALLDGRHQVVVLLFWGEQ